MANIRLKCGPEPTHMCKKTITHHMIQLTWRPLNSAFHLVNRVQQIWEQVITRVRNNEKPLNRHRFHPKFQDLKCSRGETLRRVSEAKIAGIAKWLFRLRLVVNNQICFWFRIKSDLFGLTVHIKLCTWPISDIRVNRSVPWPNIYKKACSLKVCQNLKNSGAGIHF